MSPTHRELDHDVARASTLVDLLRTRVQHHGDDTAFIFLEDGEQRESRLSYGELDRRARSIATALQAAGAAGQRVLLMYPPGLAYIEAFFACLYAGAVAVPAYPPDPARLGRTLPRLRALIADARPTLVLTTAAISKLAAPIAAQVAELTGVSWVATDGPQHEEDGWRAPSLASTDLAFLQYTSGSTSDPRGVMLSHGNLLDNLARIERSFAHSRESCAVIWLPPYHDMGLIGGILGPLYSGFRSVLMAPTAFLQRPLRWLQAVTRHRATTSGGPNFAYDLCVRKIGPEERAALDLRCWRVAFNGAEPIRAATLEAFTRAFAPAGFRSSAHYPCYGLAEATLLVTGAVPSTEPLVVAVDRGALAENRVTASDTETDDTVRFVGCGSATACQPTLIVDPVSHEPCAPDRVGEVWVASPSVARGYWGRPEDTARTFGATLAGAPDGARHLRTGDLGFLRDGQLFITGRAKDLVIIRGRNYYPQDIELTAERSHPALRPGCGAAFSVEVQGEEQLVIVHEVDAQAAAGDYGAVIDAVRRAVSEEHELRVHEVSLVARGAVHKTSSGKIQRRACRASLLAGELEVLARSAVEQAPAPALARTFARVALDALHGGDRRRLLIARLGELAVGALETTAHRLEPARSLAELGMDSLSAVDLAHAVEKDLGVTVPVEEMLSGPSLETLADVILARWDTPVAERPTAPAPTGEPHSVPLSAGQRALWFLQRLAPDAAAYHIARAVRVHGGLDAALLHRSLTALVRRHAALRTSFVERDGAPEGVVHETVRFDWHEIDARGWSEDALRAWLVATSRQPFDVASGPLLRVALLARDGDERVLLVCVHHLVADLRSMVILLEELGAVYGSLRAGKPLDLPPLAAGYDDFVRWQNDALDGATGARLASFWSERLAGELPALELPADFPRPATQTFRGRTTRFRLSEALSRNLLQRARAWGVTPFTMLLAAYQVLLHRFSGQTDIIVGAPTSGRLRADFADVVGYFVNPVALRARLDDAPSFTALVERTRREVVDALAHEGMPFPTLVERLQPRRDASRSPVFQALFVYDRSQRLGREGIASLLADDAGASMQLGELRLQALPFDLGVSQFDLTLRLAEASGLLLGTFEYNSDLFAEATVEQLGSCFETLLAALLEAPERPVGAVPLLPPAARAHLLALGRGPALEFTATTLHARVAEQAARTPHRVALRCGDDALDYRALVERARRLARRLRAAGAGAGERVAVLVDRSVDMVVAVLGALESGAAYVPIDPSTPAERCATIVSDAGVVAVITQSDLRHLLPPELPGLLEIDRKDGNGPEPEVEAGIASDARATRAGAGPDDVAYVIYTSGSTGRPKGVAVTHRSAVNLLAFMRGRHGVGVDDVFLAVTSLSFDVSVADLFLPLTCGACVVIASRAVVGDGARLAALLRDTDPTFFQATPTTCRLLLAAGWLRRSRVKLLCAGEALPRELASEVIDRVAELWNYYGPTEATVYATATQVTAGAAPITIGRAVANAATYVLDGRLEPVPLGVIGELYLAGVGLALGYLGRPGLTAERFVPDPHASAPGARMYHSGDLARLRLGGDIEYLGRADHQVKLRGFRIELGEIEAALEELAGVREAAVALRTDVPGDPRLVAYVAGEAGGRTATELRQALARKLPAYMLPATFVWLAELPKTASRKLDRRALPPPPATIPDHVDEAQAPAGEVEEAIAGHFAELLGVSRPARDSEFFALGGHSLLATRLIARIRSAFGVELPVQAIFEAPTIAGLAARIAGAMPARRPDALAPGGIERRPAGAEVASFAQERLWLLHQSSPSRHTYNVAGAVRLRGALDLPALVRSLDHLVERHEVLRTSYQEVAGKPHPVVHVAAPADLEVIDLSLGPESVRDDELAQQVRAVATAPFDLSRGPVLRACIVRLSSHEHVLCLVAHHIAVDGWSLGILVRELGALYAVGGDPDAAHLPPLSVQYGDFAWWQRRSLAGEALAQEVDYWRTRLAGAPPLALPVDRPRPAAPSQRGAQHRFRLSGSLRARLEKLAQREGATLYITMLAAWTALLGRHARQDDVVVASPIANRRWLECEPLVGCFVNTLATRTDLSSDPSFRALLARVRAATLEAFEHQDAPFEHVFDAVASAQGRSSLPSVAFLLQDAPHSGLQFAGIDAEPLPVDTHTAKFDLTLDVQVVPDGLTGWLEYASDMFDATTAARLVRQFELVLEAIVADPEQRISTWSLADEAERQRLLVEWNATTTRYRRDMLVHECFAEQRALRPDAPAMEWSGRTWSYAQLDGAANRLARCLQRHGVAAESRVGICLPRSAESVIAMLAILKAGGAYVPLDPEYPAQRLALIMRDAEVRVVVTRDAHTGKLVEPGLALVRLDLDAESIAAESDAPIGARGSARALAYVMYTSGSTGIPKGVAIEHRGIVRLVDETNYVRVAVGDRMSQGSTMTFDMATFEIWGALINGATLVGLPHEVVITPHLLARALEHMRIDILSLPTAVFNQTARRLPGAFARVREVIFGGEAADPGALALVLAAERPRRLVNGYGPTECTTYSTTFDVERVDGPIPIGRPIGNSTAYVLDAEMQLVPVGMVGELYLGGDGVGRGYIARPQQTAERFVPDPYGGVPGARLYRTGDLVRWREDGVIEFMGRVDDQVKIRGLRIEPGEITAVLAAHPDVQEAAVVARFDTPGDARLVAYVVARAGHPFAPAALRAHLAERLPAYMVPTAFVSLPALPLSSSGKVDRRALPAPPASVPHDLGDGAGSRTAPRTASEVAMAAIWSALLHRDALGVDDDFFELGGHSLLAAQLAGQISEELGVELPLRTVFERPTIAALCTAIDEARTARHGVGIDRQASPIPRRARESREAPLSLPQERFWFLGQLGGTGAVYTIAGAARLRGVLDVQALSRTFAEVSRRHEVLRTRVRTPGGQPAGVVEDDAAPLVVETLDVGDTSDIERLLETRLSEEAARPIDLASAPPWRVTLWRVRPNEHLLMVALHHAAGDAASLQVLFREIEALYAAFSSGRPSPLSELTLQYADYARWQRERCATIPEAAATYWRSALADLSGAAELPTDRPRPAMPSYQGATLSFTVAAPLASRLRELARAEGATLFMTVLAAFDVLVARSAGASSVVVGTPVTNRERSELQPLIGCFVNTLPIQADLSGNPSFRTLLGRVRATFLEAMAFRELPFEKLVELARAPRDPGRNPLFQLMLAWHEGLRPPSLPGLEVTLQPVERHAAQVDLTLAVEDRSEELVCSLEYATDLFEPETIENLRERWLRLLEAIASHPEARIGELAMTSARDTELLAAWSRPPATTPAEAPVHERVRRAAIARPDAPALRCGAEAISRGELERRANALAHHMIGLGVRKGDVLVLGLERSLDTIIAMLAALKAGAAFLPIDPQHPRERWAVVIADARVRLVVTTSAWAERAGDSVTTLLLDGARPAIDSQPDTAPDVPIDDADLAYVIYTSGTTGRPKGVMVSHGALSRHATAAAGSFGLGPEDRVLQLASPAFDVALEEIFPTLISGAVLVIWPGLAPPGASELERLIAREALTIVNLPASYWHAWVDGFPASGAVRPQKLRLVVVGSEAVASDRVRGFRARMGADVRLLAAYGPTEATITATLYEVAPEQPIAGRTVPIGTPRADAEVHLLDDELRPVLPGTPGEVWIAGGCLARGYLDQPALTAERFLPDPFAASPGARMYRTGDRARRLADGALEFLGRADDQIKVRGVRIEPGEIERALERHAGVARAVVLGHVDQRDETSLVAWFVPRAPVPSADELRAHVRELLPAAMCPASFVEIASVPLTPAGKLDRRALPAPVKPVTTSVLIEPADEIERCITDIWRQVLGVERIGVDQNFFDLGGHSLLLVRVQQQLAETLRADVPMLVLLQRATVRSLAAYLAGEGKTDTDTQGRQRGHQRLAATSQLLAARATQRGRKPTTGDQ